MTANEDFKKPLNIVFLLLAIVGVVSGFYFYHDTKKTKSISYHITEPASLIYDSKNSSSTIKVLEKDSVPIKDNVYLLTGIIWNSGNVPISLEDVRQNISLNLLSAKKILDFKIVKQTDPTISKFKLTKDGFNSLNLSWKYFDPGYAFKFQIIYSGYENPRFNLTGKILDIKEFNKITYSEVINGWFLLSMAMIISIGSVFSITIIIKIFFRNKVDVTFNFSQYLMMSVIFFAAAFYLILKFHYHSEVNIPLTGLSI